MKFIYTYAYIYTSGRLCKKYSVQIYSKLGIYPDENNKDNGYNGQVEEFLMCIVWLFNDTQLFV